MLLRYILLSLSFIALANSYLIGTGKADITGSIAQVMLMGYAVIGQTGEGLLQRLYARAFIIEENGSRIVFVNTDTQSMGDIIKTFVIDELKTKYGTLYTEKNIMISSTHSHSGMGGYLQHTLYEISALGWIEETTKPLINGIVQAIINAHDHLQEGSIHLSMGELLNTNINRSPQSYLLNPENERSLYKYNVDKMMTVVSFKGANQDDLGLVSWFPVHGVSVNNTNRLINGDNKGYAAYYTEKKKGTSFVAAFAQSNEGDVSPNTLGAFCTGTDISCDGTYGSKCPNSSTCNGRGPGYKTSDLESNRIIGQNQAQKALQLFNMSQYVLNGKVDYAQRYWDITKAMVTDINGRKVHPCDPAMGYAFAAGTTDGPAMNGFYQNTTKGTFIWDMIKNAVQKPSHEQASCQYPKPILLDTGEIKILKPWQPVILDVQLFRIGNVFIYAVPAEFTTMSGRRLKDAIKKAVIKYGLGDQDTTIIHSGPANGYASYCATYEEYQHQRYEGASTPYGPHTLQAYITAFEDLVYMMAYPDTHGIQSEELPNLLNQTFNLSPLYRSDQPHLFKKFGSVINDIEFDTYTLNKPVISCSFVAGNPRNDPMIDKTFLTVEKKKNDTWETVLTDHDYETRFYWKYTRQLLGMSEATIEWHVADDTETGVYRIGYFGNHRSPFKKTIMPHHGYSKEFIITK